MYVYKYESIKKNVTRRWLHNWITLHGRMIPWRMG